MGNTHRYRVCAIFQIIYLSINITHREYAPLALTKYHSQAGETNYLATLFGLDNKPSESCSEHPCKCHHIDEAVQLQDTTAWTSLLHLDTHVVELHAHVEKHESLSTNKHHFCTPAFSTLIEQLIEQNDTQNQFSSYMSFMGNTCNWSDFSALMILHHAINTAEMFTSLDIEQHKTNLLQRALSSELA